MREPAPTRDRDGSTVTATVRARCSAQLAGESGRNRRTAERWQMDGRSAGVGAGQDGRHTKPPALIGNVAVRVLKRAALPKHIPGRLRGVAMALQGIPGSP